MAGGRLIYVGAGTSGRLALQDAVELNPTHAYAMGLSLMTDAISVLLMDFSGAVVDHALVQMPEMTRVRLERPGRRWAPGRANTRRHSSSKAS